MKEEGAQPGLHMATLSFGYAEPLTGARFDIHSKLAFLAQAETSFGSCILFPSSTKLDWQPMHVDGSRLFSFKAYSHFIANSEQVAAPFEAI